MKINHLYWRAGFGPDTNILQSKKDLKTCIQSLFQFKKFEPLEVTPQNTENLQQLAESKNIEDLKEARKLSRQMIRKLNLAWLDKMTNSNEPLREKMAFFWHGHFACRSNNIFHNQLYINTLREKGLGKFEDLVIAVAKQPAMLDFLNNRQNKKEKPNENFARELMELFTLGRGNYTEKDIKESARAFTGWGFVGNQFVFRKKLHDFEEKNFLGEKGNFDGEDIIKIILKKKQTAIFITQKIYRFFVNEKLNEKRVQKLADIFYESNYDITLLMKTIFESDWFYDKENIGVKIKSPIEWIVGMERQINFNFTNENVLLFVQKVLGQMLLFPPNVAGWAGGKNWIDSATLMFRLRFPNLLAQKNDLDIEAKDENDAGVAGIFENRIQKIGATFNWQAWENIFKSLDKNKSFEQMAKYIWQVENPDLLEKIKNYVQQENENKIPKFIMALLGTPEYQMM
jgi:uncharacterized protein (DUF1800 family)